MNIYALKDRLIDYFMVPFAAPGDKEVLAAVAKTINGGSNNEDIQTAPHQFEIWKLAKITDDGHVIEDRYLVADCASLVRTGVRRGTATDPRQVPGPTGPGGQPPQGTPGGPGAFERAAQTAVQAANGAAYDASTPANRADRRAT